MVRLRVKPILDDFQACYCLKCRWFAGFYFLARQVLFMAYSIPHDTLPQDTSTLLCTNALVFIIHSIAQPYKSKWLNTLDTLLLLDVVLLSILRLDWDTKFMHQAIPYLLILPPIFYYLSVIVFIVCKRLWSCSCSKKALKAMMKGCKQDMFESFVHVQPPPTSTTIDVGLDTKHDCSDRAARSMALMSSGFFRDRGKCEPDTASLSDRAEAGRARAGSYLHRGRGGPAL